MAIFCSYMPLEPSTNETYSTYLFALSLLTDLEEPMLLLSLLSLLWFAPSLNSCLF